MQQQQQQDVHVAARIRPLLDRDAANALPGTSSQQGLRVYRDGSIGVLLQQPPQQPTMMSPTGANDAGGGGGVDAIGNPATTFAFDFVFDHSRPAQSSSSHSTASPSSLLVNSVAPTTSSTAAANHHNSNAHVVETLLSPLRDAVVQGTNIAVVAYGASGTGKTHTIFGGGGGNSISDNNNHNEGMAQIFFRQLMEDAVKRKNPFASSRTTFSLSLFELYNEKVRDLVVVTGGKGGGAEPQSATLTSSATMSSFAPSSPGSPLLSTSASISLGGAATTGSSSSGGALRRTATAGTLRGSRHGSHAQSSADLSRAAAALSSTMDDFREVKLRSNKLGVVLDGVQRAPVATTEDLASLFSQSLGNRLTCAGRQNPRSSQSHAVAQLVMRQEDYAQGLAVVTSVTFVDLAGSERGPTGPVEREELEESGEAMHAACTFRSLRCGA